MPSPPLFQFPTVASSFPGSAFTMFETYSSIFLKATTFLGLLTFSWTLYRLIDFLLFHFTASRDPLAAYRPAFPSHGEIDGPRPYALITGSSGGIGFGLAVSLVKRGFGVILLSSDETKLQSAKQKLIREYPTSASSIELVYLDAVTASVEDMQNRIVDNCIKLKNLTVTILINNVGGVPLPFPQFRVINDYEPMHIDDTINMNARFMAQLTRIMLPELSSTGVVSTQPKSNRSLIINMSSGARSGIPWQSIYSATKAFNAAFSMSLAREFKATGLPIDCIAVVPGDVLSDGNNVGLGVWSPTASHYGEILLNRVDAAVHRRRLWMSPYWLHAIQIAIVEWLPESVLSTVLADKMLEKKRAFEKEKQKQK
jgi:17beta-estradiol 17-dehydrogenase / very-long-chain 3-oxoacyl-CoA reductase